MGPARRTAGRDRPRLKRKIQRLRTRRCAAGRTDRRPAAAAPAACHPRARRDPAALGRPPRLLALLEALVGLSLRLCARSLAVRRLDGDRRAAQRGDFRRGDVGIRRNRCARLLRMRARLPACGKAACAGAAGGAGDAVGAGKSGCVRRERGVFDCGDLGFGGVGAGVSAGAAVSPRPAPDVSATGISGFAMSGGAASRRRTLLRLQRFGRAWRGSRLRLGRRRCGCGAAPPVQRRGTLSGAFCSAAGGSTRSIASTGLRARSAAAQTRFRGRRAMTGCWQIPRGPRAAAPPRRARRPGSTSTTRSRRTENGSRAAWTRSSAFAGYLQRPLSHRERGDHRIGRVRDAADTASAQRIRLIREYRNGFPALVKNRRREWPPQPGRKSFPGRCGSAATALPGHHKCRNSGANWPDLS